MTDPDLLKSLARPLFDFADKVGTAPEVDPRVALAELQRLVHQFQDEAYLKGVPDAEIGAAKYALLVLIDFKARRNRAVPDKTWTASARASVYEGRDMDRAGLVRAIEKGEQAGPQFEGVLVFLRDIQRRIDTILNTRPKKRRTGLWIGLSVTAALVLGACGWIGWQEVRFRADLIATLPDAETMIARAQGASIQSYANDLETLAEARVRVAEAAREAPFGLITLLDATNPATSADRAYSALADARLPQLTADVIGIVLATEGEALPLYDTLRANAILTGASDWQPYFLAGWLAAQEHQVSGVSALAPHVLALSGPGQGLRDQDPLLVDQARGFAAEAPEAARAHLELTRLEAVANLPRWRPSERLPRMATVFFRRSGVPLEDGVAGLFTPAGWDFAKTRGATEAVALTRAASVSLMKATARPDPATEAQVLDVLQADTLETWKAFLADIRVRPFTDQPSAVLISGALGARNSPLTALLNEVWLQAGGRDRTRSHANQLKIAATFGPMIQFAEQGGTDNVAHLFATLNVALSALDANADIGVTRLTSVQDRANSIATLQLAPRVVVQIIEDVLAQVTLSSEDQLSGRFNTLWRATIYAECQRVVAGNYPFTDGPDTDFGAFTELFRPTGTIPAFYGQYLARLMDMSESPWRWKPEARLSGINPESAGFFEAAMAISEAYFGGTEIPNADLTFTTLAQRGEAFISIGGQKSPVLAGGATISADWPGPLPQQGVEVVFQANEGAESLAHPGPWGLIHVIDGLRLRERDEGARFLLDVKFGENRVFLEMGLDRARNPVSRRHLLRGLVCPASL